jgi:hypothetical protein
MRVAAPPHMGQAEVDCVERRNTHTFPSWEEHAVISRPEGKANKGVADMWVEKHSMRRKDEKTFVLYFITHIPDHQE